MRDPGPEPLPIGSPIVLDVCGPDDIWYVWQDSPVLDRTWVLKDEDGKPWPAERSRVRCLAEGEWTIKLLRHAEAVATRSWHEAALHLVETPLLPADDIEALWQARAILAQARTWSKYKESLNATALAS